MTAADLAARLDARRTVPPVCERPPGYRELLALEDAHDLLDEIVELRIALDAERLLRRHALALLHERGREIDRLRDQIHRLHAEYRRLRETILRRAAA